MIPARPGWLSFADYIHLGENMNRMGCAETRSSWEATQPRNGCVVIAPLSAHRDRHDPRQVHFIGAHSNVWQEVGRWS
jgi:hypothetical protein